MTLTDLHVSLHVARGPRDLLNGGPPGAILPGFFVRAHRNEGYQDLLGEGERADRQVTLDHALAIADAVDAATGLGPRVRGALLAAAEQMAKDIEGQIAGAEAAIAKLPRLRESIDRLREAQSELAVTASGKWYRVVSGANELTLRWLEADDMADAARQWSEMAGDPTASIQGPHDSPVIGQ